MSDDDEQVPPEDAEPDPATRARQQAQGAAGDLARMGIDPRSLGLGDAAPPRTVREPGPADEPERAAEPERSSVVPLRPDLRMDAAPAEPSRADEPPVTAAERLLAGTPAPQAPRVAPGRVLRSVAKGLLLPDAALAMQDERALVEAVRQRQSERRIVAFVSGKGGVGCTTVAMGTGITLAAMRQDHSVVIDVQQGAPSLAALNGVAEPLGVESLLASTEAVDPPRTPAGLGVVDGPTWDRGLTRADVGGILERLGTAHAFNLLDVGDDPGEGAHSGLARADQFVVVTGPGAVGAAALRTVLERLRRVNPAAARRSVNVIVCTHEAAHRETRAEVGRSGEGPGFVLLPPEPLLAAGGRFDPGAVTAETREALLRVAAAVASAGVAG